MGKSKAEIQREYRERKKLQEGENYLKRERARVKGYYVPIAERPKKKANEIRKKVREAVRKHRKKLKLELSQASIQDSEITSSTEASSTSSMVVKLPAIDLRNRTRRRVSRATAKCRRTIEKLNEENRNLGRRVKTISKRYQRLLSRTKATMQAGDSEKSNAQPVLTPRKRTSTEIREEGLTPSKMSKTIQRKLLLANVLTDELHGTWKENGTKGKKLISKIISGKLLKKYRLRKYVGRSLTKKIFNSKKISAFPIIQKKVEARESLRNTVIRFLERDDNSRMMPGKNDKKKTQSGHMQKRVLNDSMSCLHMKFVSETSEKISLATFCRLRPNYICLTKFISRNTCLCQKHQNMALALKNLKAVGVKVPASPDEFARQVKENNIDLNDIFLEISAENIKYEQWKKVEMPDGKKRTRIVEKEIKKEDFVTAVQTQICEFQEHVARVRLQYKALHSLKDNLPEGHVIVQMDFAENFTCSSAEEVQSAYWNPSAVTLHPVVTYYRALDGKLAHENYVFVSDDLAHNFGTVYAILDKLMPMIKMKIPHLKTVHYWTDSPSSQYRNKSSFYIVSDHETIFGASAVWNFFESGHGKGPCDGIGGTSKRTADLAIKQGKITVQDAFDYHDKVQQYHRSATYVFVKSEECATKRDELTEINRNLQPVKGTMQLHCVIGLEKGKLATSITSCYCSDCIQYKYHNTSEASLFKKNKKDAAVDDDVIDDTSREEHRAHGSEDRSVAADVNDSEENTVGEYVATCYDNDWFVGKILEVDKDDDELLITFLRPSHKTFPGARTLYKWPVNPDELWVKSSEILCKVSEPTKHGRTGRSLEITQEDFDTATAKFASKL
jgi:hypothetical protein